MDDTKKTLYPYQEYRVIIPCNIEKNQKLFNFPIYTNF